MNKWFAGCGNVKLFALHKKHHFDSWKDSITQDIDKALESLPYTFKSSCILDIAEVSKNINSPHDRFVIVPVDKTSNNFRNVCNNFYLDVIRNVLSISNYGNIIYDKVYKLVYWEAEEI